MGSGARDGSCVLRVVGRVGSTAPAPASLSSSASAPSPHPLPLPCLCPAPPPPPLAQGAMGLEGRQAAGRLDRPGGRGRAGRGRALEGVGRELTWGGGMGPTYDTGKDPPTRVPRRACLGRLLASLAAASCPRPPSLVGSGLGLLPRRPSPAPPRPALGGPRPRPRAAVVQPLAGLASGG